MCQQCVSEKSQALGKGEMMEMKGKGRLSSVVGFLGFSDGLVSTKNGDSASDNGPMGVHMATMKTSSARMWSWPARPMLKQQQQRFHSQQLNNGADFIYPISWVLTRKNGFRGLNRRQWGNMLEWQGMSQSWGLIVTAKTGLVGWLMLSRGERLISWSGVVCCLSYFFMRNPGQPFFGLEWSYRLPRDVHIPYNHVPGHLGRLTWACPRGSLLVKDLHDTWSHWSTTIS